MTAAMLATSSKQALWFASRGTGIVCLLLLTTSVVLGIITSVRFETRQWPRFVLERLHRNVSLLILVFIGIHVATTVIDGYVPIGYVDAVIPFRSPYRTLWLGLGAVALDLLLALAITSVVRVRLGYRVWRAVHWLAYACWPIALMHGLGTGSDARQGWMVALDALALASVCAAVAWRLSTTWRPDLRGQWGVLATAVTVPMAVAVWALAGPLQPGWAKSHHATATVANIAVTEPESAGFAGAVRGARTTSGSSGSSTETVSIRGSASGPLGLRLDLELTGRPLDHGVQLSAGGLSIGPATAPARWRGRVVSLDGGHVEAQVVDGSGHWLSVRMDLRIDAAGRAVTGTVTARPVSAGSTSGSG
ncbi:MAG TPA: ferric reductase-like transmembrane domain-containing protein [Acidimicrobiia bacterium]